MSFPYTFVPIDIPTFEPVKPEDLPTLPPTETEKVKEGEGGTTTNPPDIPITDNVKLFNPRRIALFVFIAVISLLVLIIIGLIYEEKRLKTSKV